MLTNSIVKFKTKGSLASIIQDGFDGVLRDYLASDKSQIIKIAQKIRKNFEGDVYLEVKYPYGFRERRIEILLKDEKSYFLIKIISDAVKVDKEAILLDQLISEIIPNMCISPYGVLIVNKEVKSSVIKDVARNLKNKFIFIQDQDLNNQAKKIKLKDFKDGIFS